MALTLPEVVAFDMLGVLLLARFVRLETAILISRPVWIIGACAVSVRSRRVSQRLPAGHRTLTFKQALAAAAAAVGAFQMSALVSRPYHIWDRHWHIPLATLFRAEKIPFDNAYDPGRLLHYHVTGDVLGSMLQTLSLCVVNSSLALSLAHDVMFGLIAASTTLLLFAFDFKRLWSAPIASIALLLQGPATMRGNLGRDFYGYSFDSLLIAGFRPHVPLAGLLIVGCVGSIAVRLRPGFDHAPAKPGTCRRGAEIRPATTLPVLVASGVLLSITDEASLAIIVVALACAWCVAPAVVSRTRLGGILGFALLGAASIGAQWLFNGSFAPGGPVQSVRWVAARSPGTQFCEPLALTTEDGQIALLFDLLPLMACAAGLTIACLKRPRAFGTLAFAGGALTVALFLFTRIEINHAHAEAQRFMIAPCFVVLLLALVWLPRVPAGSFASAMVVGGLVLAAFSTTSWLRQRLSDADPERADRDPLNLHTLNCRESMGARLGEKPIVAWDPLESTCRHASLSIL